jgi:ABC-type Fe3+/spermidine/putrescine transport system ATPase subunit
VLALWTTCKSEGIGVTLVSAVQLSKTYRAGDVDVPAVRDVNFTIEPGAFVAFVGPSGSGKSTLLNMIGCMDHPTGGKLSVLETDVATLDRRVPGDGVRADRRGLQGRAGRPRRRLGGFRRET